MCYSATVTAAMCFLFEYCSSSNSSKHLKSREIFKTRAEAFSLCARDGGRFRVWSEAEYGT